MRGTYALLCGVMLLLAAVSHSADQPSLADQIDIPFQVFTLDNGLTLIVSEDHKAPIVAVNVWYHVGSKDEKPGKTGFAHLYEHLMFNGSEHYNDDYFKPLRPAGATDLNGTTSWDRTNYFQNVPTSALDMVLWLESDRMGYMKGAISQEKLDEQRGVVQNEKRQGENEPYGKMFEYISANCYPDDHPYSWTVIGSMEDLTAASLEDVHEWFDKYYGAANAYLAIVGDVDTEEIKKKVEHYFGEIPSGPPLPKQEAWVARRTGSHRMEVADRVPQARITKVWNTAEWGTEDNVYLSLFAEVLASGKNSRLYKRLVYEDQTATDVSAFNFSRELSSLFMIDVSVQPGKDVAQVEQALDEEFNRLLSEGPTEKELERVKMSTLSSLVKGLQRIGGFGGKSDILLEYAVYGGDPASYRQDLKTYETATVEQVKNAAQIWLSDGVFVLEYHPFDDYKTVETEVDRSQLPAIAETPDAKFPEFQRGKLANGLNVIVAHRDVVPVVDMLLVLDIGAAADEQRDLPGLTKLALSMLDEGTEQRNALEISEQLQLLGASISTFSTLDASVVVLSALKSTLDEALNIYADVILNPSFDAEELERQRQQQLAEIRQEKKDPSSMAGRVLPQLLFGENHAYSNPRSGNEESVGKITVQDLTQFHEQWFKPNHATVVAVGDITLDELVPKLEAAFQNWQPGEIPEKNLAAVDFPEKSTVYILDRPDSESSVVLAAHLAPPKSSPDDMTLDTLNMVLGGDFTSRINMNLREDKHWSYGAHSDFRNARGPGVFAVSTSVQADKTAESMTEIKREIQAIQSDRPPTEEELNTILKKQVLQLTGRWETLGAVAGSLQEMIEYNLPEDYYDTYSEAVRKIEVGMLSDAAKKYLKPENLTWVVVGDRQSIEESIRALNLGEVKILNADGELVQ